MGRRAGPVCPDAPGPMPQIRSGAVVLPRAVAGGGRGRFLEPVEGHAPWSFVRGPWSVVELPLCAPNEPCSSLGHLAWGPRSPRSGPPTTDHGQRTKGSAPRLHGLLRIGGDGARI